MYEGLLCSDDKSIIPLTQVGVSSPYGGTKAMVPPEVSLHTRRHGPIIL